MEVPAIRIELEARRPVPRIVDARRPIQGGPGDPGGLDEAFDERVKLGLVVEPVVEVDGAGRGGEGEDEQDGGDDGSRAARGDGRWAEVLFGQVFPVEDDRDGRDHGRGKDPAREAQGDEVFEIEKGEALRRGGGREPGQKVEERPPGEDLVLFDEDLVPAAADDAQDEPGDEAGTQEGLPPAGRQERCLEDEAADRAGGGEKAGHRGEAPLFAVGAEEEKARGDDAPEQGQSRVHLPEDDGNADHEEGLFEALEPGADEGFGLGGR